MKAVLKAAERSLESCDSARLDCELLLAHVLGWSRTQLLIHRDKVLDLEQQSLMNGLVARRAKGEPIAYILGSQEFWSMEFSVSPAVLIPRPDTETLVEAALAFLARVSHAPKVLELGCGSGCISVALKKEQASAVIEAIDKSSAALAVAKENARTHLGAGAIHFYQSDWFSKVRGSYDLIITNPPYIAEQDPHLAALNYEPIEALTAADNGFCDIKKIIVQAKSYLKPGGLLLLEHGYDQGLQVLEALRNAGFEECKAHTDLSQIHRASSGNAKSG